jgi:hypothetical protein
MFSQITLPNGNVYALIAMPSYPGFAQFSLTQTDSVAVVSSPFVPGQTQIQAWPGADAWSVEFTLPKMTIQTAAPWRSFMAELRGMKNVFQIGDPFSVTPQGQAEGTPVTYGTNLASSYQLTTIGWTANTYRQLISGDYLQIGYRLYQCCDDIETDSSGSAIIPIFPSLRESLAPGLPIVLFNTQGLFRLSTNTRTWHADYTRLFQMSFKAVEVR